MHPEKYIIVDNDHEGRCFGPFNSERDAAEFALDRLGANWAVKRLYSPE
jgi:hypothetical protein